MTQTWQLQNELVFTSWSPLWAPPWLSCPWPNQWFWIQPWLGPSQNRSWLVWPATAHPHCSCWSLGCGGWPPQTWGMGWWNPMSLLVPITDLGAGSAVQDPCKTGNLCLRPEHPNQSVWSFPAHLLSLRLWLLECPTKQAMGLGLRKGTGVTSDHPFFWSPFIVVGLGLGPGREFWGPTVGCCGWCWWAAFPQFPLDWFNVLAGVAHSQAIWPQPWHLKHWRELQSFLLALSSLGSWVFCPWCLLLVVPVPWPTDAL